MKLKLENYDLHRIKDAAQQAFIQGHIFGLDSELQILARYLQALSAFAKANGVDLEFELPTRRHYESVDED